MFISLPSSYYDITDRVRQDNLLCLQCRRALGIQNGYHFDASLLKAGLLLCARIFFILFCVCASMFMTQIEEEPYIALSEHFQLSLHLLKNEWETFCPKKS